jgi:hypothetical protein
MTDSTYLRARGAQLMAFSYTIMDVASKAALIEVASNLIRWADELDGIDPPRCNGA